MSCLICLMQLLPQSTPYAALQSVIYSCSSGQQIGNLQVMSTQQKPSVPQWKETMLTCCPSTFHHSRCRAQGCMLWPCTTAKASLQLACKQLPTPAHSCRCCFSVVPPSTSAAPPLIPPSCHKGRSPYSTQSRGHVQQPSPHCCSAHLHAGIPQPARLLPSSLH